MAARVEAHPDPVARRDERHSRADALHDAGALVAEHGGQGHRVPLVAHDEIGVADARGGDAHEHLVGAEIAELELLQRERRARALGHCGSDLHGSPFVRCVQVTLEICAHPAAVRRAGRSGGAA